jgi:hypothetical protein
VRQHKKGDIGAMTVEEIITKLTVENTITTITT